jgi:hypothetical protein
MENQFTSITGIVIPASWDTSGAILGTAIVTFDEDIVTVADTTPALNRSEDMGAWMIWVRVHPVFLNIS